MKKTEDRGQGIEDSEQENRGTQMTQIEQINTDKNTCGMCRWLETTDGPPYCIISDYFTHRYADSPACDEYNAL
jgi:hypothetical protein